MKVNVASAIKKFEKGEALSDKELKTIIPIYVKAVNALETLNQRKHDLITNDIRDRVYRLQSYEVARKRRA